MPMVRPTAAPLRSGPTERLFRLVAIGSSGAVAAAVTHAHSGEAHQAAPLEPAVPFPSPRRCNQWRACASLAGRVRHIS